MARATGVAWASQTLLCAPGSACTGPGLEWRHRGPQTLSTRLRRCQHQSGACPAWEKSGVTTKPHVTCCNQQRCPLARGPMVIDDGHRLYRCTAEGLEGWDDTGCFPMLLMAASYRPGPATIDCCHSQCTHVQPWLVIRGLGCASSKQFVEPTPLGPPTLAAACQHQTRAWLQRSWQVLWHGQWGRREDWCPCCVLQDQDPLCLA